MRRTLISILVLAACGGGESSSTPDAPGNAADAGYDEARCLIKGDFGAVGSVTGTASMGGITVTLDAGPPRDTFFLRMNAGMGVFTGGIAPGMYTISGADAGYNTCGLCVNIIADIVTGSGPSKFYFATSGMVTLTSTASPIAGSAQNLQFVEVDINSGNPVPGGCTGSIDSISFTTM